VSGDSDDASSARVRFPPGTRFGAYEVVRPLGAGAFGSVYEARRLPLGNRFALKVLHPELASSPKIVARFTREAEATAQIRHPHVVNTFEVGVAERVPYIAMEFLVGETLRARSERSGPMPLELVADLLIPVCSAVAAVHAHHLVHRDLKPDNIMITEPRPGVLHSIVLDFGVARALAPEAMHLTTAQAVLGTPLYMSPEQLMDPETVDGRSDQWALGVIVYGCLAGVLPFAAKTLPELMLKIATVSPAPVSSHVADVPPEIDALVARALQREPSARFGSAREIGAALLPYASLSVRASWEQEFAGFRVTNPAPFPAVPPPALAAPALAAPAPLRRAPEHRPWRLGAAAALGAAVVAGGALVAYAVTRSAPAAGRLRDPAPPVTQLHAPPASRDADAVAEAAAPVVASLLDASVTDVVAPTQRPLRPRVVARARAAVAPAPDRPSVLVGANGAVMR
jgi:hypothetical protein